jgi:hypothetical protein
MPLIIPGQPIPPPSRWERFIDWTDRVTGYLGAVLRRRRFERHGWTWLGRDTRYDDQPRPGANYLWRSRNGDVCDTWQVADRLRRDAKRSDYAGSSTRKL